MLNFTVGIALAVLLVFVWVLLIIIACVNLFLSILDYSRMRALYTLDGESTELHRGKLLHNLAVSASRLAASSALYSRLSLQTVSSAA